MTRDKTNAQVQQQPAKPDPALKRLDVLIGTWDLKDRTLDSDKDNVFGWNTFEWLPGGFFLKSTGEINFKGVVLQYYWDIQGNTVTHSDKSSKYTGILSEDGRTLSGGWRPKEGEQESLENSYDAIMTRVE